MEKVLTGTLGKVALFGLAALPVCGYSFRWLVQEKIKNSASHSEVIEFIKSHDGVKQLMGEPFKIGRIDIGIDDTIGQIDNTKWFTLPISGPKANGNLTYWVTITDSTNNEFHVSKIEIKAQDRDKPMKKWRLLLRDDENTVKSIDK